MFSAFHCTSETTPTSRTGREEGYLGISGLSIASGQWRSRTLNYRGHRGNQRPDLCSFHNHRAPLRALQSAGTQKYPLQWKPASAGVGRDRLLRAPKVRSKLTLAKDTGGKLFVFIKAMVLYGCKWPLMHSETHPQGTARSFHQEDEVQTAWAVISTSGSVEIRYLRENTTTLTFLRGQIYSQQRKKTSHSCEIKLIKN